MSALPRPPLPPCGPAAPTSVTTREGRGAHSTPGMAGMVGGTPKTPVPPAVPPAVSPVAVTPAAATPAGGWLDQLRHLWTHLFDTAPVVKSTLRHSSARLLNHTAAPRELSAPASPPVAPASTRDSKFSSRVPPPARAPQGPPARAPQGVVARSGFGRGGLPPAAAGPLPDAVPPANTAQVDDAASVSPTVSGAAIPIFAPSSGSADVDAPVVSAVVPQPATVAAPAAASAGAPVSAPPASTTMAELLLPEEAVVATASYATACAAARTAQEVGNLASLCREQAQREVAAFSDLCQRERIYILSLMVAVTQRHRETGGALGSEFKVPRTSDGRYADLFRIHDTGRVYLGDSHNGQPEGYGILRAPVGSLYEGEWSGGKRQGLGQLVSPDGRLYRGQFRFDLKNGFGQMDFCPNIPDLRVTHCRYEGQFLNDMRHGFGAISLPDGSTIFARHESNQVHLDTVSILYPDGVRYDGELVDGLAHGGGILRFPDGWSYADCWEHGVPSTKGVLVSPDGVHYAEGLKGQRLGRRLFFAHPRKLRT